MKKVLEFETIPHRNKKWCNLELSRKCGQFIQLKITSRYNFETDLELCQIDPEKVDILIKALEELRDM